MKDEHQEAERQERQEKPPIILRLTKQQAIDRFLDMYSLSMLETNRYKHDL